MTIRRGRDNDVLVCSIQERLLEMTIGCTCVVHGRVVTRHTKDTFEIDTALGDNAWSAESVAEEIADSSDGVFEYSILQTTRDLARVRRAVLDRLSRDI